jgi:hypothetical protein
MPEDTTTTANLPSSPPDESPSPAADAPADPAAASASAEIFAAMDGSTLTEAGESDEYGGEQAGIEQQFEEIDKAEPPSA